MLPKTHLSEQPARETSLGVPIAVSDEPYSIILAGENGKRRKTERQDIFPSYWNPTPYKFTKKCQFNIHHQWYAVGLSTKLNVTLSQMLLQWWLPKHMGYGDISRPPEMLVNTSEYPASTFALPTSTLSLRLQKLKPYAPDCSDTMSPTATFSPGAFTPNH